MLSPAVHEPLRALTLQSLDRIARSEFGVAGCRNGIAYYDSRKDELILGSLAFSEAVKAMASIPEVKDCYGESESPRLTLQFVFNACCLVAEGKEAEEAFKATLEAFERENSRNHWTYRSIANVQNFESAELPLQFADGLSFRARSARELELLLGWGQFELRHLLDDMRHGAFGSNVLMIESNARKSPENFLLSSDGTEHPRIARLLLAMRLAKPGEVRVGRVFAARPVDFNVGMGGLTMHGFSNWHPGAAYVLTKEDVPSISKIYNDLLVLDKQPPKDSRNLKLALRAFASVYDRLLHQADDRIVDAITALEALWKLESELSFRLAFRTSSLLAKSDDERVFLYRQLFDYYKIRSKLVHGGGLSTEQEAKIIDDSPLREIVRRCLRGFLSIAVNASNWSLSRLEQDTDALLLHGDMRKSIQIAMGI